MKVRYRSNNSGGYWWLDKKDWLNLEKAGWVVKWDDFLGSPAREATKEFSSIEEGVKDWETVVGQSADDDGCPCCGRPHYFYEAWND